MHESLEPSADYSNLAQGATGLRLMNAVVDHADFGDGSNKVHEEAAYLRILLGYAHEAHVVSDSFMAVHRSAEDSPVPADVVAEQPKRSHEWGAPLPSAQDPDHNSEQREPTTILHWLAEEASNEQLIDFFREYTYQIARVLERPDQQELVQAKLLEYRAGLEVSKEAGLEFPRTQTRIQRQIDSGTGPYRIRIADELLLAIGGAAAYVTRPRPGKVGQIVFGVSHDAHTASGTIEPGLQAHGFHEFGHAFMQVTGKNKIMSESLATHQDLYLQGKREVESLSPGDDDALPPYSRYQKILATMLRIQQKYGSNATVASMLQDYDRRTEPDTSVMTPKGDEADFVGWAWGSVGGLATIERNRYKRTGIYDSKDPFIDAQMTSASLRLASEVVLNAAVYSEMLLEGDREGYPGKVPNIKAYSPLEIRSTALDTARGPAAFRRT